MRMIAKNTFWRTPAAHAARFGVGALLLVTCGACMSVSYDMRKLSQPVIMNRNPFVHAVESRVQLAPVDTYQAMVFNAMVVTSQGGPGGSSQTTTTSAAVNEAQAKAFEKIGGDNSLAITDVMLNANSFGMNLLFGVADRVEIIGKGSVQKIVTPGPAPKVQP